MSTKILALLLVVIISITATTVFALNLVKFCKNNPIKCIKWIFHHPNEVKDYCDENSKKCETVFDRLVDYCVANKDKCKNVCLSYFDQCKTAFQWFCNNYPGKCASVCIDHPKACDALL